jgi:hypothetical protein
VGIEIDESTHHCCDLKLRIAASEDPPASAARSDYGGSPMSIWLRCRRRSRAPAQLLHPVRSARAVAELRVGDTAMFANRSGPWYLEHEVAEVTEAGDRRSPSSPGCALSI